MTPGETAAIAVCAFLFGMVVIMAILCLPMFTKSSKRYCLVKLHHEEHADEDVEYRCHVCFPSERSQ